MRYDHRDHLRKTVPCTSRKEVHRCEEARQFLESARSERNALYAVYVLILGLGLTWDDDDSLLY